MFGVVAGLDRARINPAGLVAGTNLLPVDGGASDFGAAPDEFVSLGQADVQLLVLHLGDHLADEVQDLAVAATSERQVS